MKHQIREATISDVETIRQLANEIWWDCYAPILEPEQITYMLAEIYSTAKLTEQIKNGTQIYLLLVAEAQPVAFAAFAVREENKEIYKLHKLYCLPAMQGRGFGKALLNAVMQRVKAAGKSILELNVNKYNKAKAVYEKAGFNVIYEEDIPIGPYFMNDFVMRKEL
ncbi:GNAT family N-acetyltransferase [Mucilaginibacter hurinus]|uniref:GNAT family N-acetyltransferase n=1 Tax=Mucilaginibacter hurinus TaxID=2201324 RepID=A0A367GM43_9SPHI|nr:GNAT family N-acetyltransferase [Mucilaginibacter hurinus]RCH54529.1 GNAT family N-acetyltransferase [Mucilaginibacter hurinus]